MIRDPFYRQIIGCLEGPLDPELFEQCAADLLRVIYPTLVPIHGGGDSGMDGAIADGKGEPFPLVSTTGKDVIDNLTRNLKSYLQDGGLRRKVVLATSQKLTPRRIRNLYKRASELGFTLVNVYTQEAMANLLYRSPNWCLALLNLTGDPPALSAVPLTERPLLTHTLVGREAELFWLRQNRDDRLLVGQPGSGKTFLLRELAMDGGGLFVVSEDRGEIAATLRAEQPEVLIVDDAQLYRERLKHLRQIREAIGAGFSILASCWPGDQEMLAADLNLTDPHIHHLEPLTRDEIVEVVKATGIGGPNWLIREIVDQAEGRPGLAVTLAHLCLQGGVEEVAFGDALRRSFLRFFDTVVGQRASVVLAAFSVGGDAGMPMDVVARGLGLNSVDVMETIVKLAGGGVVRDVGQHCLSVRPAALRHVLVRDVFFTGAASLPIEPLLAQAPSLSQAARTLIGAKAVGGDIRQELLIGVLEEASSEDAWKAYAWLGRAEATWTLRNHPEKIITIARPALQQAPETVIPLLLEAAVGDQHPLHSTPEHPLRLIEDWIHAGRPGTGQGFERRRVLLQLAQDWLISGRDVGVGLRAFRSVLSPKFEYHTTDPGMGDTLTIHYGYPSMDELLAIQSLWAKVLEAIKMIEVVDWESIRSMIEAWAYPGRVNVKISPETSHTMRFFADRMLRDIVSLAKDRPGVLHWISQIAEHLDVEVEIPLDPAFETLYPVEDVEDWKAAEEQQISAVRELANVWSKLNPVRVIERIVSIEHEAQSTGVTWPRWTPLLCLELARDTMSPNAWIRAMIDTDAAGDLVAPFLRRAAEIEELGWIELAFACLERPTLRWVTISLVLTLFDPPENLLAGVLQEMDGYAQLVETLCLRNEIPEHLVGRLLRHKDAAIANAAAQGEWLADPQGAVRDSLRSDWREAVKNSVGGGYWFSEILKGDPSLAYDWLQYRISKEPPEFFRYERTIKAAVSALDVDARRQILRQVPETYEVAELVACLIGENLVLYRELLNDERLKYLHLVPLSGYPEETWVEKAKLALDASYSIEEVADAVYGYPMIVSWSGKESAMWAEWVERFGQLCSHEDERIRRVGEAGRAKAEASWDRALERERNEAIYGIG
jgi:hypothetical protein